MRKLLALALVAGSGAITAQAPAFAAYPERPVTAIVSFPAGGATDLVARGLQEAFGRALGQQLVVKNVNGASGTIGAAEAAAVVAPSSRFRYVVGGEDRAAARDRDAGATHARGERKARRRLRVDPDGQHQRRAHPGTARETRRRRQASGVAHPAVGGRLRPAGHAGDRSRRRGLARAQHRGARYSAESRRGVLLESWQHHAAQLLGHRAGRSRKELFPAHVSFRLSRARLSHGARRLGRENPRRAGQQHGRTADDRDGRPSSEGHGDDRRRLSGGRECHRGLAQCEAMAAFDRAGRKRHTFGGNPFGVFDDSTQCLH